MVEAKIKNVSRLTNASALARELGVTREYLWRVRTGRMQSRRLEAKLKEHGIHVRRHVNKRMRSMLADLEIAGSGERGAGNGNLD